jgi:hypothetical protein
VKNGREGAVLPFPFRAGARRIGVLGRLLLSRTHVMRLVMPTYLHAVLLTVLCLSLEPILSAEVQTREAVSGVTIQCIMFECAPGTVRELFKDDLGAGRVHVVNEEAIRRIREFEEQKKIIVLCRPQLATVPGNTAQVKQVTELNYVVGYNVDETSATAQKEVREVGTMLNVTPTVDPDGLGINLTLVLDYSIVVRPVRTTELMLPLARTSATIDCPEFHSSQVTTTVQMKSGGTVLLSVSNASASETQEAPARVTLVMVTATVSAKK